MRRVLLLVAGLGLLGTALGCHHTHGICDCELPAAGPGGPVPHHVGAPAVSYGSITPDVTYPAAPGVTYPSTAVPTATPEAIRVMPKAVESK